MLIRKNYSFWLLLLITFLGAFLRLNQFLSSPPGFHIDESDIGYQAYSLLETGKDYYGNFLPIHPQSFVDRRPFLYMYLLIPFIKLLGLTPLAIRLPAVLFGILTIPAIYWLGRNFSKKIGLSSAFILAILPWHIHYSRIGYELTTLVFLFTLGLGFLVRYLNTNKVHYLNLGLVFCLLSFYTYSTATLVIPLVMAILFIPRIKSLPKLSIIFGLLLLLPFIWDSLHGIGGGRFKILSVFTDTNSISEYLHLKWLSTYAGFWGKFSKIFLNNPVHLLYQILSQYLSTFSPQYLIFSGDPNPRHVVPVSGVAGLSITSLFIIGIFRLLHQKDQLLKKLFLILLLTAPISSAITRDGIYHSTRLFLLTLPLSLIAGFGLTYLLSDLKQRSILFLVIILTVIMPFEVLRDQFLRLGVYPISAFNSYNYGWKELVSKTQTLAKDYDYVIIDNSEGAPIQTLWAFFSQANPGEFQQYAKSPDISVNQLGLTAKQFTNNNILFSKADFSNLSAANYQRVLMIIPAKQINPEQLSQLNLVDKVLDPMHQDLFYLLSSKKVAVIKRG